MFCIQGKLESVQTAYAGRRWFITDFLKLWAYQVQFSITSLLASPFLRSLIWLHISNMSLSCLQFASWTLPGSFGQRQILFVHRRRHSVEGVGRRRSFWLAYSESPHRERPAVWLPSELGKLITTPLFLQKPVCAWFAGLTIVIIKVFITISCTFSPPVFCKGGCLYTRRRQPFSYSLFLSAHKILYMFSS